MIERDVLRASDKPEAAQPPAVLGAVPEEGRSAARDFLTATGAVLWKDLVAELRSREVISAMLVFALLTVITFNFALELRMDRAGLIAPGLIWVTILFAGSLGLNRSLAVEKDRGSLDGLMLCPVDRSALYFGKLAGNVLFMLVVEAAMLPLSVVLLGLTVPGWQLVLVLLLGTFGLAGVGTLLSALAVHTRAREVMLPILLLPTAVPVMLAAVRATGLIWAGAPWDEIRPWLDLLMVYDVVMFAIAYMIFDYVLEE